MVENDSVMIVKANGEEVPFESAKLIRSLRRAGASKGLSQLILKQIKSTIYPGISSSVIYESAYELLREHSNRHAGRYKLKQAILELGPSGFPFEEFVAELLKSDGYKTEQNLNLRGRCVRHEVDVKGEKEGQMLLIECKYHGQRGQKSDVKTALYVKARFQDIEEQLQSESPKDGKHFEPWLVTNTRFSDDAARFGQCSGMHLVAWDHPEIGSLKDMVEKSGLYPITCLSTINKREKGKLLNAKIVLCREIIADPIHLDKVGIKGDRKRRVLEEAEKLLKKAENGN